MTGRNSNRFDKVCVIVLDSCGIGDSRDAVDFGDSGNNTFVHALEAVSPAYIPNLVSLGILETDPRAVAYTSSTLRLIRTASFSLEEKSSEKDTLTGHWEMMGIVSSIPMSTFTECGFPPELITAIEKISKRHVIGNRSENGQKILEELAAFEKNNNLIVYTSDDSVLQVCGDEDSMGLEELYRICSEIRKMTVNSIWRIGRIIARPYRIINGQVIRTCNRRDYVIEPPENAVDIISDKSIDCIAIGKISDIFGHRGFSRQLHSIDSKEGMEQVISCFEDGFNGFCYANLVDFDTKFGHMRDANGYGHALEYFDKQLGRLLPIIDEKSLLIITADHGNDPTAKGNGHTRENVPMLMYSPSLSVPSYIKTRVEGFGAVGATVCDALGCIDDFKEKRLSGNSLIG